MTQGSNLTTLNYDIEDRVTSLVANGVTSSYVYNGLDTRVSKTSPTGGNRTYKRDGAYVTDPVLADGSATMVPGISERRSGATSVLHTDRLGSMSKLTASGQNVTDTVQYDAFGLVTNRTGTSPTQKGFASDWGYQEDGESGLKLLGHRLYDPGSGRFITRDGAKAGSNWYTYCGNEPLARYDDDGQFQRKLNQKDYESAFKKNAYRPIDAASILIPNSPPGSSLDRDVSWLSNFSGSQIPFVLAWMYRPGGSWDFKSQDPMFRHYGNFHFGH